MTVWRLLRVLTASAAFILALALSWSFSFGASGWTVLLAMLCCAAGVVMLDDES